MVVDFKDLPAELDTRDAAVDREEVEGHSLPLADLQPLQVTVHASVDVGHLVALHEILGKARDLS